MKMLHLATLSFSYIVIQAETAVIGKSHTKDFSVKVHIKVVGVRNRIINSQMSPSLFRKVIYS